MENNFNNILSDKFKSHRPEVPAHLWAAIEPNLPKNKDYNKGMALLIWGLFMSTALCGMHLIDVYLQRQYPLYSFKEVYMMQQGAASISDNSFQILVSNYKDQNKSFSITESKKNITNAAAAFDIENSSAISCNSSRNGLVDHLPSAIEQKTSPISSKKTLQDLDISSKLSNIYSSKQHTNHQILTASHQRQVDNYLSISNANGSQLPMEDNVTRWLSALSSACKSDTLALKDTVAYLATEALTTSKPKYAPKNLNDVPFKNDVKISFSPIKVFNTLGGVDQGYNIAATYGRSIDNFKTNLGVSFTSLGSPIHYKVPENPGFPHSLGTDKAAEFDVTNPLTANTYYKPRQTLTSMSTLGISLGLGVHKPIHAKWALEAGLSLQPSVILRSKYVVEQTYIVGSRKEIDGLRRFALSTKADIGIAYKPIKKAEISCGIQLGYYLTSIHHEEVIKPLSLGPVFGLKWMF